MDDPQPLCPAAFLGSEIVTEPIGCYVQLMADHLQKRAKYVEETRKHLEQHWKLEDVTTLSNNLQGQSCRLTKGDVVLLVDEQGKREHWRLARVGELCAGHGGQCGVALVSCGGKDRFLRPVRILVPLEVYHDTAEHKTENEDQPVADTTQNGHYLQQRSLVKTRARIVLPAKRLVW